MRRRPGPRRGAWRLALVAVASVLPATRAAWADPSARARYFLDGDAKALVAALVASADPADRDDLSLARLASEPRATLDDAASASPLLRAVDALRRGDLDGARAASPPSGVRADDARGSILAALFDARIGHDEEALRRLVDGAPPSLVRDGAALALLGAALPADDRQLLSGCLRAAVTRAGAAGRAETLSALAESAAALDADAGARALVEGARALRRAGHPAAALALLDGTAAARCGRARPALRLERAILAWRRNDPQTARAESTPADASATPWAFEALSHAGPSCAVVPAPPLLPKEMGDDADAEALARCLTTIGIAVRPEDVSTRAAARSTTAADPAFVRSYLASLDVARLETADDPTVVTGALALGLPVLLWRPRRDGERFVDRPILLRGHDPATGLLCADEPDPRRLDVIPSTWVRKARALVVAPKARAGELAAWRDGLAARRGARLADGLAGLFGAKPELAGAALAEACREFQDDPALRFYEGYATYVPAYAAHDVAGLAAAAATLRQSSAHAPVTVLERLMRAEGALGADADPALSELDEAVRTEGNAAWIEITRFVILSSSRRHAEALGALDRARALDPLDVRTLYFRAGTRRLLGDGPGGAADLVRVLERRPDHVPAAEDLASSYVEDGAPERALEVVRRLVAADPAAGQTRRVHQLRQRVEARLVRKARSAEDLAALATSPEPDVRAEVAWTASSFETDAAEALLRSFLADTDESVRRRAALAYQRPSLSDRVQRDPTLLALLVSRLGADPAPVVREALARALTHVDAPAARDALASRLAGPAADAAIGVRAAIADLLSGPSDVVTKALVDALADPESAVRRPAIASLRRITGTNEGFEPDDPPDRRAAAIAAWRRRLATRR